MSEPSTTASSGTIYTSIELIPDYYRQVAEDIDYTVDANKNIHIDIADEKVTDLIDNSLSAFAGALVDVKDDADDDSLVVIDDYPDDFKQVDLADIGEQHKSDIIRVEAQVQDLGKPTINNYTAEWECQNKHRSQIAYERWVKTLKPPVVCNNDSCNDRPTKRIPNSGTQINTQQLVLSESDKDDRNSRSLIAEVDEPYIGEFDRRANVELLAEVHIADRQNESKVEPYLHVIGFEEIGHTVDLDDERVDELEKIVDESDDIIIDLQNSVAPQIVDKSGQKEAKLAGLCSIVKGANHTDRNMIHTMFYGKRGSGKSKIMEFIDEIANISQFVDAQSASKAGLTATATQTSKLQGEGEQWVVTSGSIPQAHEGVALVDELDKAEERVQTSIANPMSSGRVIKKTAGEAELTAETSIVSASNPENQSYDGQEPIDSLDIPTHIQSRFDLIIRVDDEIQDEDDERELMRKIAERKQGQYDVPIDKDTLRDYVAYAKRKDVEMTDDAQDEIIDRILELRMDIKKSSLSNIEMSGREQEKLTRLSSAMAKLRLGDEVQEKDVKRAWNLMLYGMQSITWDTLNLLPANLGGSQ